MTRAYVSAGHDLPTFVIAFLPVYTLLCMPLHIVPCALCPFIFNLCCEHTGSCFYKCGILTNSNQNAFLPGRTFRRRGLLVPFFQCKIAIVLVVSIRNADASMSTHYRQPSTQSYDGVILRVAASAAKRKLRLSDLSQKH